MANVICMFTFCGFPRKCLPQTCTLVIINEYNHPARDLKIAAIGPILNKTAIPYDVCMTQGGPHSPPPQPSRAQSLLMRQLQVAWSLAEGRLTGNLAARSPFFSQT